MSNYKQMISETATEIEAKLRNGFDPSWEQLVILFASKGCLLVSVAQRRKYGYCYIPRQSYARYALFHTEPFTNVYFSSPAAAWGWYHKKVFEEGSEWFNRLPELEDKWQVELRRIAENALTEINGGKTKRRKINGFTSTVWKEVSECSDAAALRLLLQKVEKQIQLVERESA